MARHWPQLTLFDYDNVGNLTWVTDPRTYRIYNTYDARNRKVTTTEAYGTSLARTTTWHYDNAVSNIYQIDRPDNTQRDKELRRSEPSSHRTLSLRRQIRL